MKIKTLQKLALIPLAGLAACTGNQEQEQQKEKPNVLFIAIDDLNDWIGPLDGKPKANTPNLDRLADDGMVFTRAYCSAPESGPSRASLMTGIQPNRSGLYFNPQRAWENPLLARSTTLPQHFRHHGYYASGAGKIYHWTHEHPESWNDYWPTNNKTCNRPPDPEPDSNLAGPASQWHFDWGGFNVDSAYSDYKVTTWASKQLLKEHDQPFFLACGIYRPHLPWYVPQKYFDMYPLDSITVPKVKEDDLADIPEIGRQIALNNTDHERITSNNAWKEAVQGYLACITFADAMLGRVLDALEKGPNADNTVIVLWSDHGWHLGEKHHWRKFTLWEEAAHNVLMFAGPGVEAGTRCETPVGLIDIYPTLCDLCHIPMKDSIDGKSLLPLINDPDAEWERPALTTFGYKNHALRTEKWRYICYKDGTEELYDHENDPMEWNNLANNDEYQEVIEKLKQWLPETNAELYPPKKKEH